MAAIVVHLGVLMCWLLLLIWDLPVFNYTTPEQDDPKEEPEVTVLIRPFITKQDPIIQPAPPPEPQPQPKPEKPVPPPPPVIPPPMDVAKADPPKPFPDAKRKFARTSADQAGAPDEPTDILGERDTLAASELAPTPGARPNTPSQDGRNPLFPGQVETVTREYKDGSVGMDETGEETETPQEETAARKDNSETDIAPKVDPVKPESEDSARPKNKHMAEGKVLPNSDAGEGKGVVQDKPKENDSPKERPNEGDNKNSKGKVVDQAPKKDEFSGYSRKNRVTGSITRRGKSSLNVKNSPLGRYQAQVSKAVELQWRRNCEQHRDHIVPGVISLRFYVDSTGKVSGIKFQEVVAGNYIERGFTQRAIRQAKLPKMSKSVVKELAGDPLELIYNFYF